MREHAGSRQDTQALCDSSRSDLLRATSPGFAASILPSPHPPGAIWDRLVRMTSNLLHQSLAPQGAFSEHAPAKELHYKKVVLLLK
jgi:hypothetical protein